MKLRRISSKSALITTGVVAGLLVGGFGVTKSEAAMDWLGFEQKIANHDQQLDNHEDRIGNTEKDVEDLQEATNTAPSTEKVIVREVVTENPTPAPTPAQEPAPVVITAWEVIPEGEVKNCKYTLSDGTTRVFKWKWTEGPYTHTSNKCDASVIGTISPV